MPNSVVSATIAFQYQAQDGSSRSVALPLSADFSAYNDGKIDVPDATASGTPFNVPFGSIGTDCRFSVVQNNTGQPLEMHLNGSVTANYTLAPGGIQVVGGPAASGSTPILSMSLKLTALQAGAGSIGYWNFGDPV